jgi:uncharacterized membrane protein YphA (DoxX/SURF4 family)
MSTLKAYLNKETLFTLPTLGWVVSALVSFMMVMSGGSKLVGTQEMVGNFEFMNLSPYLMLVGLLEVVGAVMLMVPRLSQYGATLIGSVMTGAVCMHLSLGFPGTELPIMLGVGGFLGYKLRNL